ncbi:Panacea domain-containing protein [Croceicoccus sp. Ery5]|uniref:Panacea domain-containing protein n=1 Tax=Croceicoccus sp. Ery5 TaxID=1703340 RepID=UPI00351D6C25
MQLYKIVYFAHGWYLAVKGRKLVKQSFEAWSYGPVLRILRDQFRQFEKRSIDVKAEVFDIFTGEVFEAPVVSDELDREFIITIFNSYRDYDGWTLSDITHEPGSPWDNVWNSDKPVGNLALRIDDEAIRSYFVQLPNRFVSH